MYWTSITRLLHHLRTEKARLTIWLFTSGITFLLLYFFWEPKVRSFPKELVRIERMADTRPAAALQELERYDTTKCMPDTIHEEFPRLNDVLRSIPHLSEMNLQMCLLVKADFKPVEIARILCRDKSTINSARRRLYERVFDEKGSPSQWDEFIRNI